ncbi:MAG: Rne/Rng family ribonuclease [Bacteroidetes bacterium]|nr:Rne/Rng family ribonuclease [Bacteroidota bacterium]
MTKEIIINSTASQNRVAITENSNLVDFFVDHPEKKRMVGNIYLGKVARVLPGIRAAFVDIGLKHDAFLHFSDIGDKLEDMKGIFDDDESDFEDDENNVDADDKQKEKQGDVKKEEHREKQTPKLKKGEEIVVQIIKEPVKGKGVRVSSSISMPGRFCVLLPFDNKIGVSKKISDFRERRRLRKLARGILPQDCGLIIRTAAKDQTEESLSGDLKFLVNNWSEIQQRIKNQSPPSIVHEDLSTTVSVIRDLFTPDVSKIFIDSKKLFKEIKDYVQFFQPELVKRVDLYKSSVSIFEEFKIEEQIKKLMGVRVPLPSGGHIVIEHTEAMVVVDVNSGRYAAKKDQELNSLKTDLEASREIVRQLRLRDIGGLIVVDFIDLEDDKNRKKIYDELKKEFKKDRAKIAMLPMTEFGLMQITRERIRENILQSMHEPCPYCEGTGLVTKKSNVAHEIEEWLKRFKQENKSKPLILKIHPNLQDTLKRGRISFFSKLRFKYVFRLRMELDEKMSIQKFQFIDLRTGEDITDNYS